MNKRIQKILIDLSLWTIALPLSYVLRLDREVAAHLSDIALLTACTVPLKGTVLYISGFHNQSWHKIGVWDLFRIVEGVTLFLVLMVLAAYILQPWLFVPLTVPLIEAIITVFLLSLVRLTARMKYERRLSVHVRRSGEPVKRVLIAGAGEAGTILAREIHRHPRSRMQIVGFLDDHPSKQKEWFMGLPVVGALNDLKKVVRKHHIDKVIIAMPTVPGHVIRKVVERSREAGVENQIMPGLYDLLSGKFRISQLRNVNLEDLLRRKAVELDLEPISGYLTGRTVLVTGAGGSIGSEIVRQITRFQPKHILLLGRGENSIYRFEGECRREYPEITFSALITDVRDRQTLEYHFKRYRPEVVFHAAAHKHVPLMEDNPDQAILNNVGGTQNLVELALQYHVERFVNISSDKSVNPTSVMGASKRVAEYIVCRAAEKAEKGQEFVSVRFGNVLGSRGSVVPLFKQQIRNGGPVTITHPEMTRYFMTIPEASQLVLQAGGLGGNGSVYVLDMEQPVKIVDLATDLISLSGLEAGVDIEIAYTGMRPGEKLFEELLTAEEGTDATRHSKIFTARTRGLPSDRIDDMIRELFAVAEKRDGEAIRQQLKQLIPTYTCHSDGDAAVNVTGHD